MEKESFETTAAKFSLPPDRLDKLCDELYSILAAYDSKEIQAVAELIENGTLPRNCGKGVER